MKKSTIELRENKKGITLVALVITIVVLLILAGVSINLAVGNQGILTKSKKVSEDTKQAAIKEQIDLALTNYQIEKIANDNLNFKDYMEDEEQSGIENFPDFTNNNGVFSLTTDSSRLISSSDFIEVDTSKKYYQAMIWKQKENIGFHYIGFAEYDRDKNLIAN